MPDLDKIDEWTLDDYAIDMFCGVTQCDGCKHYRGSGMCKAYPEAYPGKHIPIEILMGDHDHTKPYPGDNGITFEPKNK